MTTKPQQLQGFTGQDSSDSSNGITVNCCSQSEPSPTKPPTPNLGGTFSASGGETTINSSSSASALGYDNYARTTQQAVNAVKIAEKNIQISEVNIGGDAKLDWRDWAETLKDRPMPISYELVGIWNLMNDTLADSFYQAYKDIEDLNTRNERMDATDFTSEMKFGVFNGNGEPLTVYNSNPYAEYNLLLQVDEIKATSTSELNDFIIFGDNFQPEVNRPTQKDMVACGLGGGGVNFFNTTVNSVIFLKYCGINDWDVQSPFLPVRDIPDIKYSKGKICPKDKYIEGVRVLQHHVGSESEVEAKYSNLFLFLGIDIACNYLGGDVLSRDVIRVLCLYDDDDQYKCEHDLEWDEWKFLPEPATAFTSNVIIGANVDVFTIFGVYVMSSLSFKYREEINGRVGLADPVITYSANWSRKIDIPTTIFSSIIVGKAGQSIYEERHMFGFEDHTSIKSKLSILNTVPFALSEDYSSCGVLAVSNFGDVSLNEKD